MAILNLHANETVTACLPAAIVKDCSLCIHCMEPAFRIVQITNKFGQRRYISLCANQFMHACMQFPDLLEVDIQRVLQETG